MTERWDGRPENPERDGWHWLKLPDEPPEAWFWMSKSGVFVDGSEGGSPNTEHPDWSYLGPCLTPDEVWEREEEAAKYMRKMAADELDCGCDNRDAVLEKLKKRGCREAGWLCQHDTLCCAILAAETRALPLRKRKIK